MGLIIDSIDMREKFYGVYNQTYEYTTNEGYINEKKLFVDKSNIINDFNKLINQDGSKNICITKPRRFGKTLITAMVACYYSKGIDFKEIFDQLKVSKGKSSDEKINKKEREQYEKYQNKFHTLYLNFSYNVIYYNNLNEYLASINEYLKKDIEELYPDSKILKNYNTTIYKNLCWLYNELKVKFVLIIDEWDYIITSSKFSNDDKDNYLHFLKYLIKDKGYVAFTYMTGITPIAKELSQSIINCFIEYSMLEDKKYYQYFGFTEEEVKELCKDNATINYEKLEEWYNGYKGPKGEIIFNPWSVCHALKRNKISNYWSNAGRFDELKQIINLNINGIREDIISLITKEKKIDNFTKIWGRRYTK